MKAVCVVSGGMDSVTMASMVAEKADDLYVIAFNYGQRHLKELEFAALTADRLRAELHIVSLVDLRLLLQSSLTGYGSVPEGHYADESMKATVVPNRNAIMLNIAIGWAISLQADHVFTGVHAGDHPVYPDCRPLFINTMQQLAKVANEGFIKPNFTLEAPFLHLTKADIVQIGARLKDPVPFEYTWSCYQGGAVHCGKCGTCVERREAFSIAGVPDPTEYARA